MTLAFRILYAAYGKGTHHKLALDALCELSGPDAQAWQNVFLLHAARFVEGAKAPDDKFKDFTNHVLHPRDKFWGGAPKAATQWYGSCVAALAAQDWETAAYNAGVLSHYVADPLMPFHTAQSEAENNIHRACEWSINRAYDSLRAEGLVRTPHPVVEVGLGEGWLIDLVRACASRSNKDYERLIAHYDITRGVVDPPAGLDPVGRRIAGDHLVYAATALARVFDRALLEAQVAPPEVNLALPALIGALTIPKAMVLKRLADAADRKQVEAMYDELMATGTVEKNLPADDRMVKEVHAVEVLGAAPKAGAAKVAAVAPAATQANPAEPDAAAGPADAAPVAALAPPPPPVMVAPPAKLLTPPPAPPFPAEIPALRAVAAPAVTPPASSVPLVKKTVDPAPAVTAAPIAKPSPERVREPTPDPVREHAVSAKLSLTDDVEAAPSIGPKTAERFAALGIKTVADFLACDPHSTARTLHHSHIDAAMLTLWQQQAHLVLDVPGLNGTQARLLTGSGYITAHDIATADTGTLCAAVLRYALSGAGQQVLRNNPAPDAARIAGWVEAAKAAA